MYVNVSLLIDLLGVRQEDGISDLIYVALQHVHGPFLLFIQLLLLVVLVLPLQRVELLPHKIEVNVFEHFIVAHIVRLLIFASKGLAFILREDCGHGLVLFLNV